MIAIMLCAGLAVSMLAGCGKKEEEPLADPVSDMAQPIETPTPEPEPEPESEPVVEEPTVKILNNDDAPEGYVYSELTGLLIDKEIENRRPIAAMVDNEITSLDHYGVNDADIVFEMMNSTANDRITRLMVLVKDWSKIERLGNIRSTRNANCILAIEWNAVLCHDGGPGIYINGLINHNELDHISGVFARIDNGKAREFTEYITQPDIEKYLVNSNIDTEYNDYYTGPHFTFAETNAQDANEYTVSIPAVDKIVLPFPHNKSELHYNEETGKYEYYEYGKPHVDGETGEVLAFDNVILQCTSFGQFDEHGYMWYNLGSTGNAYYITQGNCACATWKKGTDTMGEYERYMCNTEYLDGAGNPVVLNAGKTYIGIIPADTWDSVEIK